jgi:hypothetical protein
MKKNYLKPIMLTMSCLLINNVYPRKSFISFSAGYGIKNEYPEIAFQKRWIKGWFAD